MFLGVVFGHLRAFAGAAGSPRASLIPCVSGVVRLLVGGALTYFLWLMPRCALKLDKPQREC